MSSNQAFCPNCHAQVNIKNLERAFSSFFDEKRAEIRQIKKTLPVYIGIKYEGSIIKVPIGDLTTDYLEKIENLGTTEFLPRDRMPEGNEGRRNDRIGILYVDDFYTKESAFGISELYKLVDEEPIFKFAFLNTSWHASIMRRYNEGGGHRPKTGTLYVPPLSSIGNIYSIYKKKLHQLEAFIEYIKEKKERSVVQVASCNNLIVPSNSVDYIFTDPPFGANISYSELNSIWEGWLRVHTKVELEAIENPSVNKDSEFYYSLMLSSMKEYYRILKPGKWMTVEFSNTSAAVWNSIQTAIKGAGFIIASVNALDKKQGSISAYTTTTAVKQDLIISCFKPSEKMLNLFKQTSEPEKNVWDFVGELLEHLPVHVEREQKTTAVVERSPKILYDRLISYYVQRGFPVPLDAGKFQEGLRERFVERDGMYFTAEQAARYDEMRKKTEGFQATLFFVDSEQGGIGWLNNELDRHPQTYQELQPKWMQAIQGLRKGDILPELMQILEENFIQEADGKWRKPNLQDDIDLNLLRNKSLMREFKVYVEIANKPKGKIKEARLEALRAGFKQCYVDKDFETIVKVSDRIPANLLQEDDVLLQYYDIALNKVNV